MKTTAKIITAKEFQRNRGNILKAVREGQSFQVTFHRKPVANITPAVKPNAKTTTKPERGTYAAVLESLKHAQQATGDLYNLSYKELRDRMMEEKYGRYRR
jgi:antitoxin (DNA-binding transcriptional repressor) of toxin-antitoxin stability system